MQEMNEKIVAMAIACIAEEMDMDFHGVRVISFQEIHRSSLEEFIAKNNLNYRKYQLGDEIQ